MNVTNDGNGDGDNDDDDHHHRNKSFSETKNEKKDPVNHIWIYSTESSAVTFNKIYNDNYRQTVNHNDNDDNYVLYGFSFENKTKQKMDINNFL